MDGPAYSAALDRAIALAAVSHRHQARKGSDVPYVTHPVNVAIILLRYGFPEEVVLAGVLHDVVEDCGVGLETIAAEFGNSVATLVSAVTAPKMDGAGGGGRPWKAKKEEQLKRLSGAPSLLGKSVAALKAADALHNCQSTLRDVARDGIAAWSRFTASASDQLWYYGSLDAFATERLGDHPLAKELHDAVAELATLVK